MKKVLVALTVAAAVALMASCASTYPLAGATGKVGSKVGKSVATQIGAFPRTGDAGIVAAAKNGGISTVGTIDQKVEFGGFITTYTTIVTGE
jgi:hypothetical protein